ncbi:MAG: tryptophan--tRNA ligase [Bacteroidetes bacterium]|jgi:tryptophanyl-tRNA synthetase|nr:tryptophan--tRNA ligase [Bacteroidota bacterium]MBK9482314.1 tryptophan--tRNA ligase [Bacteroidota bacterium]
MNQEIVVSGIRSTGNLHLGNYFGAMKNYVKMQDEYPCYFFVADYHSLTTHPEPAALKQNVYKVLAENIACGLDPEKVTLYVQSDIPEIPELYLILNMLAYKGELEKTASFKDKARSQPDNVNAGLLTYPTLMSADIMIHKGQYVPVGKDQEQHLEMARNFAQRFNHRYGETFPEPEAFNFGTQLVKIPSLDGNGKMSKSENENATIYLCDTDEQIIKKIKKAKSDQGPLTEFSEMPDYIVNLFDLMQLVSAKETVEHFKSTFNHCTIRYGDMKMQLAEDMIKFISPIREKTISIKEDTALIQKIMKAGKEKARESASKTLAEARKKIGIHFYC